MGGIGKAIGGVLKVAAPFLGAINPLFGAAASFAGGLLKGEKPLQALMGGLTSMIPGGGGLGGLAGNLLGKFGGAAGGGLLDGLGGNGLLGGLLGQAGGKGGITDILGGLLKGVGGADKLTQMGKSNAVEQFASSMAGMFFK
jgi:hypothetical protein